MTTSRIGIATPTTSPIGRRRAVFVSLSMSLAKADQGVFSHKSHGPRHQCTFPGTAESMSPPSSGPPTRPPSWPVSRSASRSPSHLLFGQGQDHDVDQLPPGPVHLDVVSVVFPAAFSSDLCFHTSSEGREGREAAPLPHAAPSRRNPQVCRCATTRPWSKRAPRSHQAPGLVHVIGHEQYSDHEVTDHLR